MSDTTYNIAVIGQTGVGKSALINYLFGQNAPSGAGKPVTNKGFHEFDCQISQQDGHQINVKVYDSWGLEVGKHEEWNSMFKEELEKRGVDKAPQDWFHSVIYCLGASNHRVQDADIDIIKQALSNQYPVTIALTKADNLSQSDEKSIIEALNSQLQANQGEFTIIPVCSEEKETRTGVSKPFGKDELDKTIQHHILSAIRLRLPIAIKESLTREIKKWEQSSRLLVEKETKMLNIEEINEKLSTSVNELQANLHRLRDETIKDIISSYEDAYSSHNDSGKINFYLPDKSTSEMTGILKALVNVITAALFIPGMIYVLATGKGDNKTRLLSSLEDTIAQLHAWVQSETETIEKNLLQITYSQNLEEVKNE